MVAQAAAQVKPGCSKLVALTDLIRVGSLHGQRAVRGVSKGKVAWQRQC